MHPIPVTDITETPPASRFVDAAAGSATAHPIVERVLARLRPWLPWVHVFMFLVFLAVLVVPVYLPESSEQATFLDDGRVLANYLLWGVWFPLVFFSVVITGRSWCGFLCPMGAASELANRYGLKMQAPAWIRWPGTPILSFIIITLLGQTTGVRDHPEAALEIFGGTFALAVVVGWLWGHNKRVWCRHLCPIGLLLGVFSRLGAVQLSPRKWKTGPDELTDKTICPTYIDLPRKRATRHCIECLRCILPGRTAGLVVSFRRPGQELESIRDHAPDAWEILFIFLGAGVALGGFLWLMLPFYNDWRQVIGTWFIERGQYWIGEPGPSWLMSVHPDRREVFRWLDFFLITGTMMTVMALSALVLSVASLASAGLARLQGSTASLFQAFVQIGYSQAPVALMALMIGLATELFTPFIRLGMTTAQVDDVKVAMILFGWLWSIWLAWRILEGLGVDRDRWLALMPSAAGSSAMAAAWWLAVL
ncbi:MAG: 4Fe-4S binding protein [Marinobacter sp.]|uniref:4Fe-4S binding protein n=1 Tax=Marinobacter sp. TaxID=50741 RepID=UPI001B7C3CF5|nr:4Fe-4S binding protein [Marinobacter sp.]MBQ0748166.1 4Fe-4S binding protein [Marinobacter sp.]MBQ0814908.1 4Fe-4S binding protein [Marinobacter sp.]|tara:strand:+ start:3750 stop:5186 length:1437 start_codon:yes stop_codon:yes gene_type:complete